MDAPYEPIAIIGSGCRLPGGSTSPSKLWSLLREPRDLSARIPAERFNPAAFYHPDGSHHGSTNVDSAYTLDEDHMCFDAQFFQTKPVEAESMDPQQRILLETVYETIEAAGLRISDMRGSDTAVYVGVMGADYSDLLLRDLNNIPTYTSTGTARSILSNRISYFFDWHGPSLTIDTACSSSLVALHHAIQTLQNGSSRIAVAAGANLILGPENFVAESKLNMLSPDGRSRMWDSSANGYARGDGFVCVVLKRLNDAVADGDDIESVIRGSGVNQDGRTQGITVPSSKSQEALIRQVYSAAGLDVRSEADRCQYFEAHGTGTPTGDPLEAAAIAGTFFGAGITQNQKPLVVGSVKTVIGHSEGAAGLAGLLKASLAVRHGVIPPNLHLRRLNPAVRPFYEGLMIPTTLAPWPELPVGRPRRASINSFGFGGTNAHVVLESYTSEPEPPMHGSHDQSLLPFTFSAPTEDIIRESMHKYAQFLDQDFNATADLQNLAYTLACRRSVFSTRFAISAGSKNELASRLIEALASRETIVTRPRDQIQSRGVLGVFTGQGAQWVGMGRDLILRFAFASQIIDKLEGYLRELPQGEVPEWSLREELLDPRDNSRMDEATWAQPLCTAIQILLVDLLQIARVQLTAVVGHSSGEIAAAYAAGYLSDRDAMYISYFRGLHSNLSRSPTGAAGSMMAVGTTLEDAQDLCAFPELSGRIAIAAINSATSVTLSGDVDAIEVARSAFEDEGKFVRVLKVNKAYHSHHMYNCSEAYLTSLVASRIQSRDLTTAKIPWYSSVTGSLINADLDRLEDTYWNDNMVQPVLFHQAVGTALKEHGPFSMAIEVGPHPALKAPATQTFSDSGEQNIPYLGLLQRQATSIESISQLLGTVWCYLGPEAVDFESISRLCNSPPKLVKDLPSYPWDHRRRYWHESQQSSFFRTNTTAPHALLGTLLPDGTEQERRWRNVLSIAEIPWLSNHKLQGVCVFPAAGYIAMALEASLAIEPSSIHFRELHSLEINRPLTFDDEATTVETIFSLTQICKNLETNQTSASFKCFAVPRKGAANMVMVACGDLLVRPGYDPGDHLPLRMADPPKLVDIEVERLYAYLSDLGYGYTGPFRGLSHTKRKSGAVKGLVRNPWEDDIHSNLLLHPGLLDCTFQALFLAQSWPGDGMLRSLHVPTRISRVVVDGGMAQSFLRQSLELPMDCTLCPGATNTIQGEISVYPPEACAERDRAIIQVEGLELAPLSVASPEEDRKLFEDVVWGPAYPNTSIVQASTSMEGLGALAAQVTFRYPRMHILEVSNMERESFRSIPDSLGDAFLSYTIAVPPSCTLETAKSQMTERDAFEFMTFDFDQETHDLAGPAQRYGMAVVAGLESDEKVLLPLLKNLRAMLQPGGYLLIESQVHPGRISGKRLESLLHQNNFSGIDSMKTIGSTSIWATQAIDSQTSNLRSPLRTTLFSNTSHSVYIVAASSESKSSLVTDMRNELRQHFTEVIVINGIESDEISSIPATATVLSLVDLDTPIFRNLTGAKLDKLKDLFAQSRNILWATSGCLATDPYANMVVGFGRTLLLEVTSLRLQFIDLHPALTSKAELLAESLLRNVLLQRYANADTEESSLIWTAEPELALNERGDLMIPRILPSRERNLRYNSSMREVTSEVNLEATVIKAEHEETSSSLMLREVQDASATLVANDSTFVDLLVRYASVSAFLTDGVGHVFLILGTVTSTGEMVLAFSNTNASRVCIPHSWCFPCPVDMSMGEQQNFISSAIWNLYASAVMLCFYPGDVAVIYEPPEGLEVALDRVAGERRIDLHFITTSDKHALPSQSRWPHHIIRHSSPPSVIKSALPKDVSVLFTSRSVLTDSSDDTLSRISSCLPSLYRRMDSSFISKSTGSVATMSNLEGIQEKLKLISSLSSTVSHQDIDMFDVTEITKISKWHSPAILNWATSTTATVTLRPVDKQLVFDPSKTYFLAGLAGDLGQSLTEWMIRQGARYLVLTSRNPRIENAWLESLNPTKATVNILKCDITDKLSLQRTIDDVRRTLPPIAGVANGAMVLEDTPVAEMTCDKMQAVLRPKVSGSIHLDQIFSDSCLDFFILFSSVAAVVGNRGQSNYSAANAFMSSLAAQRREKGLAASVIHIGAVVGTGYLTRNVSQSVQDYLQKAGYMWMSETDFHQVFAEGVLSSPSTCGRGHEVMSGLRMVEADEVNAIWYNNPKFQHCVSSRRVAAVKNEETKQLVTLKDMINLAQSWSEARDIVRDAFLKELGRKLLLDLDTSMTDLAADELGIDSLIAISIRSWFSQELDVDIPVMRILGGATIEKIVEFCTDQLHRASSAGNTDGSRPDTIDQEDRESTVQESSQEDTFELSEKDISESTSETSREDEVGTPEMYMDTSSEAESELYPLSFSQSRFWFLQSLLDDPTTSNVTCLLSIKGPLNVNELTDAVKAVGNRHAGLRTRFIQQDGKPWQQILAKSSLRLEVMNVSDDNEVMEEFKKQQGQVFDLGSGDNIRITLLYRESLSNHLIISYHHINMDGVSLVVLLKDLEKFYIHEDLPSSVLHYPDHARDQLDALTNGKFAQDIEYWKRQYSETPPVLPILPMSWMTSREPLTRYDTHNVKVQIDSVTKSRLQSACRVYGVTPFHFYVTVFKTLLMRLSGAEDLSIGIAHAGRLNSKAFSSIGNFLNLLPLRLQSNCDNTFLECLQETKQKAYDALAHADVPIDLLFSELGVERSTDHAPLFQAFVDYRSVQEIQSLGECVIEGQEYSVGRTAYDIALDVIDNPGGNCTLFMMVQKSLYLEEHAAILLQTYTRLLETFVGDVSQKLCSPSLYSDTMITDARALGQGPLFRPTWGTLPHALDDICEQHPTRVVLKDDFDRALTYEDMSQVVAHICHSLTNTKDFSPSNTRVAVFQEPSVYWICSMLAVMRSGAAYVPLDPRLGMHRSATVLKDSKASVILAHGSTIDKIPELRVEPGVAIIDVNALRLGAQVVDAPNLANPDSTGVILYTSGSTGTPKGIALTHQSLQSQMESCIAKWKFKEEVVLQQSSYTFDFSVYQVYLALLTRGMCYVASTEARQDATVIAKIIAEEGITVTGGVPSEYITWLKLGDSDTLRASKWNTMVSGGEQFSKTLIHSLRSLGKLDLRAINIYGPSEVTISSNSVEVCYNDATDSAQIPLTVGHTMPNYSVLILDAELKPVPAGFLGQVAVAGPISSGYTNNEQLTAERFITASELVGASPAACFSKTIHLTGDLGRLHPSNGELVLRGRIAGDTQIKLRGIRIELQDIESFIVSTSNGSILRAVVSLRGTSSHEFLVAHVVMYRDRIQDEFLPDYLRDITIKLPLPEYMRPAILIPLEKLPVTMSGKTDRRAIQELPLGDQLSTENDPVEGFEDTERILKQLWKEVLRDNGLYHTHSISAQSDFFELGGNSLLLMELQAAIRHTFKTKVPLLRIFQGTSLAAMTRTVDSILRRVDDAQRSTIDWEKDAELTPKDTVALSSIRADYTNHDPIRDSCPCSTGKTVVLTGATGFLGRQLLLTLLVTPNIARVFCIATRAPDQLASFSDSRLSVYGGDLSAPRVGLSLEDAQMIFRHADIIIHNGADVSFLKTYSALRDANSGSTREIARMSLQYHQSCSTHSSQGPVFHYISTVGVFQLDSNVTEAHPVSPSKISRQPSDGANGYPISKWVSERYLENLVDHKRNYELGENQKTLRVVIHRPSSITSPGVVRSADVMQNLIGYCKQLGAVPSGLEHWWKGWIDLIDVVRVAEGIVDSMASSSTSLANPTYVHHANDHQIRIEGLKTWCEEQTGCEFVSLTRSEWIGRAKEAGMSHVVAGYMESIWAKQDLSTPRIVVG